MIAVGPIAWVSFGEWRITFVPGRHVTDHQTRLCMKYRQNNCIEVSAAKASISRATAYRIEKEVRLPWQRRRRATGVAPDPLEHIFDAEVVPLLKAAPGIRAVAIYDVQRHLTRKVCTK